MSTPSETKFSVGYGRPPAHSKWKKGQSGNPKGRPLGSKNFLMLMESVLDEQVTIKEGNGRRRISKREAIAKQIANKAAAGDHKST